MEKVGWNLQSGKAGVLLVAANFQLQTDADQTRAGEEEETPELSAYPKCWDQSYQSLTKFTDGEKREMKKGGGVVYKLTFNRLCSKDDKTDESRSSSKDIRQLQPMLTQSYN